MLVSAFYENIIVSINGLKKVILLETLEQKFLFYILVSYPVFVLTSEVFCVFRPGLLTVDALRPLRLHVGLQLVEQTLLPPPQRSGHGPGTRHYDGDGGGQDGEPGHPEQ